MISRGNSLAFLVVQTIGVRFTVLYRFPLFFPDSLATDSSVWLCELSRQGVILL
jgi:hypothetical protein